MTYLLDTSVFIAVHRQEVEASSAEELWLWMTDLFAQGHVTTISLCLDEMKAPPALVTWVKEQPASEVFVDCSAQVIQRELSEISSWVLASGKPPAHVQDFLSGADPWLIAAARAHGHQVVSQEVRSPNSHRVKIPDVADHFGVPCVRLESMLEDLGWQAGN